MMHHEHAHSLTALLQIETAYDILLMQSMKRRISGELPVSTSVRFADVPNTKKRGSRQVCAGLR